MRLDQDLKNGKTVFKYEYEYCPVNYVQMDHRALIVLFELWRQGKMLDSGGIAEQSAKYVDCMMFLDSLRNQAERQSIENIGKGK